MTNPALKPLTFIVALAANHAAVASTPEVNTRALTESLDRARRLLPKRDRAVIDAIAARNRDQIFVRLTDEGSVRLLVGEDLVSAACHAKYGGHKPSPESYRDLLRCFVAELGALASRDRSSVDPKSLELERTGSGTEPGHVLVTLTQTHEGLAVRPGMVKSTFIDGRMRTYAGAVSDTSKLPLRSPLPEIGLSLLAESAAGHPAVLEVDRYFDTKLGRFIVEYVAAEERIMIDESTGETVERAPRESGWQDQVGRTVSVTSYGSELVASHPPPTMSVTAVLKRDCSGICPFTNNCTFFPHRLNVNAGDYSIDTYGGTDMTDASIVSFADCTTGSPFVETVGSDRFYAVSGYYYLSRYAMMKQDPLSGFAYGVMSEPLEAKFQTESIGSFDGAYDADINRVRYWQDEANNDNKSANLALLGHEYGHYIHDMYGYKGKYSVREGFADHIPYRYILWDKKVNGGWPGLTYDTQLNGALNQYRTDYTITNGEYVPTLGAYQYFPDPSLCADEDLIGTAYDCGELISRIYWELSWDTCRAPYNSCVVSEDIIQSGTYSGSAWKLANSAFAYAVAHVLPDSGLRDYFDLVITKYWEFKTVDNYFSWDDYERIGDVLSRHCVGWSDHCWGETGYPTLPGNALPSQFTTKVSTFKEAEGNNLPGVNFGAASGSQHVVIGSGQTLSVPYSLVTRNYRLKIVAQQHTFPPSSITLRVTLGSLAPVNHTFTPGFFRAWHDFGLTGSVGGNINLSLQNLSAASVRVDAVLLE